MPLNILDVVELGSERIGNVDNDNFPIGLALIQESHDTENLDLLDLANIAYLLANLANIKWVVIALGFGLSMRLGRVFPGLKRNAHQEDKNICSGICAANLRKGTVVPDVPVVGEAVPDIAQAALLDVLLDGVEGLFF